MSLFALILAASAWGQSIEFTPRLHRWTCPPGALYPIMECKDQETVYPKQVLQMIDAGDGFYIAEFNAHEDDVYGSMSFLLEPKGLLSLNMSVGFDPQPQRNPGLYLEAPARAFAALMLVTGERREVKPAEILTEMEYRDLKFRP